jgi:hypothetical protein
MHQKITRSWQIFSGFHPLQGCKSSLSEDLFMYNTRLEQISQDSTGHGSIIFQVVLPGGP